MITLKDFDDIVLNNPFLTDGNTGYGFRKWFWEYQIFYDPNSLQFLGQSNSTCKYIIIKHDITKTTYKIIREDNQIEIQEIFAEKEYERENISDAKKVSEVESKFNSLKRIVQKQIKKHISTLNSLQQLKAQFDFDSTRMFLNLLSPDLKDSVKKNIINELQKVEKNPSNYFDEPIDTIVSNSKNLVQSIFFKALVDNLEKLGILIIVDWKSPYEEVLGVVIPIFEKIGITANEKMKKGKSYETTTFLNSINEILLENGHVAVELGNVSDTYLIVFTAKQNFKELEIKAKKINIEVREWKK